MLGVECWRLVQIFVEKALGLLPFRFHGRAELGDALRGGAELGQRFDAQGLDLLDDFLHEIGDEVVEQAFEGFLDEEGWLGGRILGLDLRVEFSNDWRLIQDHRQLQDAGGETILQVGGEIGDFVGEIDELGFQGWETVEEILAQFGVGGGGVIAGVLDDAFAHAEGEIEAGEGGVSELKAGDNAQGVEVVVKAKTVSAQGPIEGGLSGVAEGRMTDVVDER